MQTPEPTDAAGQPAPSALGDLLRSRLAEAPDTDALRQRLQSTDAPRQIVSLHRGGAAPADARQPETDPGVEPPRLIRAAAALLALALVLIGAALGTVATLASRGLL